MALNRTDLTGELDNLYRLISKTELSKNYSVMTPHRELIKSLLDKLRKASSNPDHHAEIVHLLLAKPSDAKLKSGGYGHHHLGMLIVASEDENLLNQYFELIENMVNHQHASKQTHQSLYNIFSAKIPATHFTLGNMMACHRDASPDTKNFTFSQIAHKKYLTLLMLLANYIDKNSIIDMLSIQENTLNTTYGMNLAKLHSNKVNISYMNVIRTLISQQSNLKAIFDLVAMKDKQGDHYGLNLIKRNVDIETIEAYIHVLVNLEKAAAVDKEAIECLLQTNNHLGDSFASLLEKHNRSDILKVLHSFGYLKQLARKPTPRVVVKSQFKNGLFSLVSSDDDVVATVANNTNRY